MVERKNMKDQKINRQSEWHYYIIIIINYINDLPSIVVSKP